MLPKRGDPRYWYATRDKCCVTQDRRAELTKAARWAMALRVFAQAKRLNEDWSESDMRAALTKESLSIAALPFTIPEPGGNAVASLCVQRP